jgi:hypothetical protein
VLHPPVESAVQGGQQFAVLVRLGRLQSIDCRLAIAQCHQRSRVQGAVFRRLGRQAHYGKVCLCRKLLLGTANMVWRKKPEQQESVPGSTIFLY